MATFDELLQLLPERHTVQVAAYVGSGPRGDVHANPVDVVGFSYGQRRTVRAPDGSTVISAATVLLPLDTNVPVRSRITLPSGTDTLVIAVSRNHGGGLTTPDHLEVICE